MRLKKSKKVKTQKDTGYIPVDMDYIDVYLSRSNLNEIMLLEKNGHRLKSPVKSGCNVGQALDLLPDEKMRQIERELMVPKGEYHLYLINVKSF